MPVTIDDAYPADAQLGDPAIPGLARIPTWEEYQTLRLAVVALIGVIDGRRAPNPDDARAFQALTDQIDIKGKV